MTEPTFKDLADRVRSLRAENEDLREELSETKRELTRLHNDNERLRAALEIAKGECEGYVLMQIENVLAGHERA